MPQPSLPSDGPELPAETFGRISGYVHTEIVHLGDRLILRARPPGWWTVGGAAIMLPFFAAAGLGIWLIASVRGPAPAEFYFIVSAVLIPTWLIVVLIGFFTQRFQAKQPPFLVRDGTTGVFAGRYFAEPISAGMVVGVVRLRFSTRRRTPGHTSYESRRPLMLVIKDGEGTEHYRLVLRYSAPREGQQLAQALGFPLEERKRSTVSLTDAQ